jgi:large subunit ribosomal protein L10
VSLNLEQKKAIVAEVAEVARIAHSAVAAEYAGLTVAEMTNLRNAARSSGVYVRVVRNTLARRAVADTAFACMGDGLVGPLLLAFSREDPGAVGRLILEYTKTNPNTKLNVKMVALGGKVMGPEAVKALATMPTRDQAIAMLMSVMNAPISKFVRTLAEPTAKLVRTVAAVRDQKQAA